MIIPKYYEYPLPVVMRYFSDGFTLKEGVIAADIPPDWFVDTGRGVVVFKLFIDDGRPEVEPDDAPPEVEYQIAPGDQQRDTA